MALVDYSSSSGESVDEEPPSKRRKATGADDDGTKAPPTTRRDESDMPALPSAFHDLYASTVRQSVSDDPNLHQGRKRLIPHVPGRWPSHVYVEWHPTNAQHGMLTQLLGEVEKELHHEIPLHGFLTSDLGAPQPLHISLSRPLSLPTADKDAFLDRVTSSIRTSGVRPFSVSPRGLAWYLSPDSDRSFLILRVDTAHESDSSTKEDDAPPPSPNPELVALLARCNAAADRFDQPPLYQKRPSEGAGTAFHVSIAWSLGTTKTEETSLRALRVFAQRRHAEMRTWQIPVSGVKVKIGNVVHHVPLSGAGKNGEINGSGREFAA